jgi:L-lysine 6-transaminase
VGLGAAGAGFAKGDHGSTFGGNPVACAAALAVLEVIERDGLCERAAAAGKRLLDGLGTIGQVDNVRGRGLFVAVDLPTREARDAALHRLHRDEKVLILGGGERSIRFRPALTISEDELDLGVAALTRAVRS